jgi:CHAD domain-containing protein/CYTH domain-containing protein
VGARPEWLELPAARGARLLALAGLGEAAEAHARLDEGGEALHDWRVALRRLRAVLAEYREPLRPGAHRRHRRRAAELVRGTGAARDAEVHAAWVEGALPALSMEERPGADRLLRRLRREAARAGAASVHGFERFRKRLARRLSTYPEPVSSNEQASAPALAGVLAARVTGAAGRLREALEVLRTEPSGEALHRARLAGKRLRYLVEPFAEALEGGAELTERLRDVQDLLGGLNDLRLLEDRIRSAVERAEARPGRAHLAAGLRALASRAAEERARDMAGIHRLCEADAVEELLAVASSAAESAAGKAKGNTEIERKYLLKAFPHLPPGAECVEIWQGWIPGERLHERIRRVRSPDGERWFRTVKLGTGVSRTEVEEETNPDLGRRLWPLTRGKRVRKRRWRVPHDGLTWEVDRFTGRDLVLAEVELPTADHSLTIPDWLGPCLVREVTGDPRYVNLNLAR